ncbi:antitoxin [Devosia geojensis]|uniref:Antitoxin n=1 Tax=Devosia geojensis TaxID=443610 RepID=A0A0F5FZ00_9HYPH|nr:type II toxin-antitoxin system VapB family antitoxin [Devosia geojensis]KKB13432.1 antitoxin [Devosia geojensis]
MRTTITLDDELIETLRRFTTAKGTSAMIREALTSYVRQEAGRRLIAMGGTEPDLEDMPRRRFPPE